MNSLKPIRDFGHAEDYVQAVYKVMQLKKPQDYIIASGKQYSVKQIVKKIFKKLNLNTKSVKEKKIFNFKTVQKKTASIKRIKKFTNWKPKKNIDQIIEELIDFELNIKK